MGRQPPAVQGSNAPRFREMRRCPGAVVKIYRAWGHGFGTRNAARTSELPSAGQPRAAVPTWSVAQGLERNLFPAMM